MQARGTRDEALKSGAGSCACAGRWSSANSAVPASGARCSESSGPHFQSDADLSRIVFGEVNAGLFKSLLYFEDSREVPFHDAVVLFDALQGCQANPSP